MPEHNLPKSRPAGIHSVCRECGRKGASPALPWRRSFRVEAGDGEHGYGDEALIQQDPPRPAGQSDSYPALPWGLRALLNIRTTHRAAPFRVGLGCAGPGWAGPGCRAMIGIASRVMRSTGPHGPDPQAPLRQTSTKDAKRGRVAGRLREQWRTAKKIPMLLHCRRFRTFRMV